PSRNAGALAHAEQERALPRLRRPNEVAITPAEQERALPRCWGARGDRRPGPHPHSPTQPPLTYAPGYAPGTGTTNRSTSSAARETRSATSEGGWRQRPST